MVEAALTTLAFLVFGVLWLAGQDWFDLLPRRISRGVAGAGAVLLAVTCYTAPSAFNAGFTRFVNGVAAAANEQTQALVSRVLHQMDAPQPPTPAPRPSRPSSAPARPSASP